MITNTHLPSLNSLDYLPYLDENGIIAENLHKKIGVYAIFDKNKQLKFIGYSRDIYASLKQHLVRQPKQCYWLKVEIIERPSRTILEEIKNNWTEENGDLSINEESYQNLWTQPIDAKVYMTGEDKETYQNSDELGQIKLLKKVSRRVQADIEETLKQRGNQTEIRFNPKLKEQGLLDLK
ncbi:GIY-YIG nuclease family protein [Cyanothece sp. BG0011]|uniref:GIY-YIG nuclease family protein n=1 Tax=Cyanothece sp. BG0011 TaxID=2082950 RepID=UPI000D1D69EB|nr:GIY-YIG nuclease family protein [Cyanothece sp. BG0011]